MSKAPFSICEIPVKGTKAVFLLVGFHSNPSALTNSYHSADPVEAYPRNFLKVKYGKAPKVFKYESREVSYNYCYSRKDTLAHKEC